MQYEPTIGLEIHTELNTKTKMFCYSANDPNEAHPNINVCPICMGHPGTLPTINEEAVKKVILVGLALGGGIAKTPRFDRKNYFYPDLPKGYQISQYQHPLVEGGFIELSSSNKIRIRRIHLEEDTGKLMHDPKTGSSLVDFNRAGVPLMELVTEPDLKSGKEVKEFGEELQKILRYISASDANMEKGQLRVEVNISLRPENPNSKVQIPNELGTKVEIKNINSFKFAADAVDYETKRQTELLERREVVIQETRGWDENKKITFSQRTKEGAHDYRYFPEPDLPPLEITEEYVEKIQVALPELPREKKKRFLKEYSIKEDAAEILIRDKNLANYFEEIISELHQHDKETKEKPEKDLERLTASFLIVELMRLLREKTAEVTEIRITPENFAELILHLAEERISNLAAKRVFEEMFKSGEDPSDIIAGLGLWQISTAGDLEDIAKHIIRENPEAVKDYKKGKEASLQFLIGQVMKESRGKANPLVVKDVMKKIISAP